MKSRKYNECFHQKAFMGWFVNSSLKAISWAWTLILLKRLITLSDVKVKIRNKMYIRKINKKFFFLIFFQQLIPLLSNFASNENFHEHFVRRKFLFILCRINERGEIKYWRSFGGLEQPTHSGVCQLWSKIFVSREWRRQFRLADCIEICAATRSRWWAANALGYRAKHCQPWKELKSG